MHSHLASSETTTCHRGLLRVSPLARCLLTSCRTGSCGSPPYEACVSDSRIRCPTRVQQLEVTRRGGTWTGNGEPQGRPRSCRRLPSEHFLRPTLSELWGRIPGVWDSLEHGDFRAMFQKPRDLGQVGTWLLGRVVRISGSGLLRGWRGPRTSW